MDLWGVVVVLNCCNLNFVLMSNRVLHNFLIIRNGSTYMDMEQQLIGSEMKTLIIFFIYVNANPFSSH
jgi:hypothetical protein